MKDVLGVVADSNQYNAADARLAISILEQRTETAGGLGMQEHLPTALSQEKSESQSPQLPRSTVNAHISRGDSSPYSGSSEQRERPQTGHGMSGGKVPAGHGSFNSVAYEATLYRNGYASGVDAGQRRLDENVDTSRLKTDFTPNETLTSKDTFGNRVSRCGSGIGSRGAGSGCRGGSTGPA